MEEDVGHDMQPLDEAKGNRCRTMDDLPVEWVQQILQFVSITDLFACMSVSSVVRMAAILEIKTRDCLIFGARGEHADLLDMVTASQQMAEDQMQSLLMMQNLKYLCIHDSTTHRVMDLIEQNAATLKSLNTNWWPPVLSRSGVCIVYPKLVRLSCPHFDAAIAAACPQLSYLNLRHNDLYEIRPRPQIPNVRMPSLSAFCTDSYEQELPPEGLHWFIEKNAATLISLSIPGYDLPRGHDGTVVYSSLKRLYCRSMNADDASVCPVLEKLSVNNVSSPLMTWNLPAETMRKLRISFFPESRMQVRQLMAGICHLSELEKLSITESDWWPGWTGEGHKRFAVTDNEIGPLFRFLHKLRDVKLIFLTDSGIESFDRIIKVLVKTNPDLDTLRIVGSNISRAGLESLSELRYLTSLSLDVKGNLTTDDFVSMLRGKLRHVLEYLSVYSWVKMKPVREEVKSVNNERMDMLPPTCELFFQQFPELHDDDHDDRAD